MATFSIKNYSYGSDRCTKYINSLSLNNKIHDENPTKEILFTSASDSTLNGKYVIKAFGIYPNGRQKTVLITGIKPFVDIEILDKRILDDFNEIVEGNNGETFTVKGRYLEGINPLTDWIRCTFESLYDRKSFLRDIQGFYEDGNLRKSNDKKTDYMVVAAQQHGFSLSVWNKFEGSPDKVIGNEIHYSVSKIKQELLPSKEASLYKNVSITWDIETYYYDNENRGDGVPLPDDPNAAMSCISMVVKLGKNIESLTTLSTYGKVSHYPGEVKPSKEQNMLELKTPITVNNHIVCKDERTMMVCFFEIIEVIKPDMMIAFNDFDYDWKWIIKRTLSHRLKVEACYALTGNMYTQKDGSEKPSRYEVDTWWDSATRDVFGVANDVDDNTDDDDSDYEDAGELEELNEDDEYADVDVRDAVGVRDGPISTKTKRNIKLEAGESMICTFPNSFCRMIFVDTRVVLRKANPKIDASSLNYFLDANGLGKKNDMDHLVAQDLTAAVYKSNNEEKKLVFDFEKYRDELTSIGIKDYRNVDEILTIMLNYCLVDSVKTAILLDKSEEILSKRMLAGVSHVTLIHALYSGVSVQITNILSEYCDLDQFKLKYSTDPPLDKDTSGKKYAGALVLAPKIMGSFTPTTISQKFNEQEYYSNKDITDTQLKLSFKAAAPPGSKNKTTTISFDVESTLITDFDERKILDDVLYGDLSEDFFISTKGMADTFINCDYKVKALRFYLKESTRTLETLGDEFDECYWLPEERYPGRYKWVNKLIEPLNCVDGKYCIRAIKRLYKHYVYVNTILNDYYSMDTKDVPAGELIWKPRFQSAQVDYHRINEITAGVIDDYTEASKILREHIEGVFYRAGCSDKQLAFFMEPTGLATTALDFASLYPSIIEEFNLSIDKMIISSGNPELYEKYKDDPDYKTIYCFYGGDEPRVAHCKNHNNNLEEYGVYAYILKRLKVIRTEIRAELGPVEKKSKALAIALGKRKPENDEERKTVLPPGDHYELEEEYASLINQEGILNSKQLAVKVVMNSFYGSTGNKNSQARCIEMSAGITAEGVKHLKLARDIIEELGVTIRYGDTDSLYFSRPVFMSETDRNNLLDFYNERISAEEYNIRDVREASVFAFNAQKKINETIKQKNNNAGVIKMAYEEALKPFFNLNKKRYFGLMHTDPDNISFDISNKDFFFKKQMFTRGMEFKKRSSTQIGIEVIKNMLYFMLNPENRSNVITFIKDEIRNITALSNNDREELLSKFAKKVMVKKRPNLIISSIKNRLPNYELIVGSSIKVVNAKDKEPPVTAKGKKEGVKKTHRCYPLDYFIENKDLELDLAGYLEGQFTTQLSDLISYLFQPYVSTYIKEYNNLTTRFPIAIDDVDSRTKVLKDLAVKSVKDFILSVTEENKEYTAEEIKSYDTFSKKVYKKLYESADFARINIYRQGDNSTKQNLRFPLQLLQRCLLDGKFCYIMRDGTSVKKNERDKNIFPNFKTRGNVKKEDRVDAINASNRIWLKDLFINVWFDNGKTLNDINIREVYESFEIYKIPFLEKLDELKVLDKYIDSLILRNRTPISEFVNGDYNIDDCVNNIINVLENERFNNSVVKDIVVFFNKVAEKCVI